MKDVEKEIMSFFEGFRDPFMQKFVQLLTPMMIEDPKSFLDGALLSAIVIFSEANKTTGDFSPLLRSYPEGNFAILFQGDEEDVHALSALLALRKKMKEKDAKETSS
jgi:hypothetical protein